jgi:transposase
LLVIITESRRKVHRGGAHSGDFATTRFSVRSRPAAAQNLRSALGQLRNSKSVGSLTRRKYKSGETDRDGAISRAGDASVRVALFEAAHVIMTRVAKWSKLKAWAMNVAKRRHAKRAKVALARKLGVVLHRMWVDETEFRFGRPAQA